YWGAIISAIGCTATVAIIILFAPKYGFIACAWATPVSNGLMVTLSYTLGRRHYPVPYDHVATLCTFTVATLLWLLSAFSSSLAYRTLLLFLYPFCLYLFSLLQRRVTLFRR
ncbi:MAG: lipopolysaccharide biosynthesis protein, partial [Tannerellaceae bacterium]|nr:lipopolysaccharide biosynthesis protein [Tannerellaceae bacterium]